ncbi:MAG: DNA polymerase III subunit beta [Burkholderiaceae bacterium]|jgi:DNA polymerase-3 subunit beta
MQLVKAQRDALLRPLQIVSGIVERRHTLPILANILIRKDGQRVSFLSTDIEVQITTSADIGSGTESFATTVAARKLLDILRALPENEEVTLSVANKKMTVQSGKSRFNLQTLPAEEFPTVAQPETYGTTLELPQKALKHLFSMVHFSMAQQDIRYYLNGLLLVVEGQQVIAVATDGHRLAYCSVSGEHEFSRQEVIIPRKTILELQRLLEDSDERVQIGLAANQVKFTFGSVELVSKLVEGKFPDFQRVIPSGYTKSFIIGREPWLHALQRVAILTSDKFKGVRFVLADHAVKITSTNADQEEAQDEIEVDYNQDALDIGFNVSYLLDVLNNLKTESIQVSVGDSNSSALITVPEHNDFKYVVMPMRI